MAKPPLFKSKVMVLPEPDATPTPVDRPSPPAPTVSVGPLPQPVGLLLAMRKIANGRLCGCKGMHDEAENDCPKTIARRCLE